MMYSEYEVESFLKM